MSDTNGAAALSFTSLFGIGGQPGRLGRRSTKSFFPNFAASTFSITMPTPNADRRPQGAQVPQAAEVATPLVGAVEGLAQPVVGALSEAEQAAVATQPAALSSAEQDRLLVQAALQGDQAAFGELVGRYQNAVYNMAYRMLGDPSDAEDAAQEVFVRAWNQLHSFQIDRRFSTWLLSIASHYCIDLLRRRRPSAPLDDVALYVQSDDPEPEELALVGEQRDMIKALLNALPDKYRTVTVLRYYNDLSYDEIARMTGLTESAVKTQLHRARRMLAGMLANTKR